MRALSLTQPWAWLVVHGGKDIENRREGFSHKSFRGEFLIHAAKAMPDDAYSAAHYLASERGVTLPPPRDLQRGGIIGSARVVDIIPPGASGRYWHFEKQWGFVLADVKALPFVACRGALGFWNVPADVAAQLRAA